MSRNAARRLKLNTLLRPPAVTPKRTLHASAPCQFAGTLGSLVEQVDTPLPAAPRLSPVEKLKRRRMQELDAALSRDEANPTQVWGMYVDLLSVVGLRNVPLETHQRVLRKSTLSPAASRADLYRRMEMKRRPRVPHVHELRYQTIINNMREAGYAPEAEDYHFILEQFAAVGHHVGALQVLQEMNYRKVPKTHKTYGLCLMALCHRLTLPVWHLDKERMTQAMSKICLKLINDMWADKVPVTAFNVDLTLRVLKETMDYESFEKLLRLSYGVDLTFPDRPPLEFWDRPAEPGAESDIRAPSVQQPFSTAALNTTLEFLGRSGKISKLIQAFEVLTTPLPSANVASPDSGYADDADEDFGINNPGVAPYTPPSAEPNTTSFHILIKWLSRHGRPALARHYVVHAMAQDRLVDRQLRGECMRKGKGEILAPHLGITQYMLLPVLGEANRHSDVEMLRFVLRKTRRALRRKRLDIGFYGEVQRRWDAEAKQAAEDAVEAAIVSHEERRARPSPSAPTPAASSSRLAPPSSSSEPLVQVPYEPVPEPSTPEGPPIKLFNVDLHLSILRRDLFHLEELERRALDTLGRKVQRLKEKLGRRIWAGKDVYLRSAAARLRPSRGFWREKVRYRATRALPDRAQELALQGARRRGTQIHMRPGAVAAQRGFFTPSSSPWAARLRQRAQGAATGTSS